ncbi:MAG: hypothetical protein ACMG55_09005 [Microcoleus sp.]
MTILSAAETWFFESWRRFTGDLAKNQVSASVAPKHLRNLVFRELAALHGRFG